MNKYIYLITIISMRDMFNTKPRRDGELVNGVRHVVGIVYADNKKHARKIIKLNIKENYAIAEDEIFTLLITSEV